MVRHGEDSFIAAALLRYRTHNLGDDVTGALHDHDIALADVLAAHVVLVMQRRVADRDTSNLHRFQHGDGDKRPGAAHVDADLQQLRLGGAGSELVGHRPARIAADDPQNVLHVVIVDFDDNAVDIIVEAGPALLPGAAFIVDGGITLVPTHPRVDAEAVFAQPFERLPV